jgi:ribosomal protein S18 acetylase RimI-like enzyme
MQARRGELVDMLEGQGLVSIRDGAPVGLVLWLIHSPTATAEVRVLVVAGAARGLGVGRALIERAAATLRDAGVRRAWLVTTNDNLAALAL